MTRTHRIARRSRAARRVVVLGGAGAMGRITVHDFLRSAAGRLDVVVADRDISSVRDARVRGIVTDVTDRKSLARALDGAFVVIASLPYVFNRTAMHGALEAGAHYIDLGGLFHETRRQMELAPEFEAAGLMALLGMGSAPGILNVQAVLGAERLDRVDAIHCMVGAADRTRFREEPLLPFGYSPDTLLDEYVLESAVFRDGRFQMVPAIDPGERIDVTFPAPIGTVTLDTTLHSEVATLPLSFVDRGVREVTFRQSFDPLFRARLLFLVELGLAGTEPLGVGNGTRVAPREMLRALLAQRPPAQPIGKPVRDEVLRTRVEGLRGGRRVRVDVDCIADSRSGWGIGPDIDTGGPPAIAVQLLASGEMPVRPGVWAPEQVVPPRPFVRALERRGMRVTVRTTPLGSRTRSKR